MSPDDSAEREYYRTPARLNVKLGPDTSEGRRLMALDGQLWEVQGGLEERASQVFEDQPVSEENKPLLDVLRWLNYKLDMVLYHLRDNELNRHFPHRGFTTDVSGSGLGLADAMDYKPDDRLLLSLTLPDAPARPIYICGQVVRRQHGEGEAQSSLAVKFLEISEPDRERLIRFTFKQQRRILSRKLSEETP